MQQVVGEVHGPGVARGRVAYVGAAAHTAGGGQQHAGAGALHERRLVARARWMPEGGRLAHADHAAAPEQAGGGGVHRRGRGEHGAQAARAEARAGGVVVVAVGRRHRLQQLLRALAAVSRLRRREDGDDLDLGVEGDARDLLLDQERVVDAVARAIPARPGPARGGEPQGDAGAERERLPGLSRLPPLVALEGGEAAEGKDGHHHTVGAVVAHLAGVGGVALLLHGPLVGLRLVGLRPVRTERAQQQAGHDALALPER